MSRNPQPISGISYPIELPVSYEILGSGSQSGNGRTRVISSETLGFDSDRILGEGLKIRVNVAWPAALPDGTRLNLCIHGEVVRSDATGTTVKVIRYEFRTRRPIRSASDPLGGSSVESGIGRTAGASG
jgi:hypothetical protein